MTMELDQNYRNIQIVIKAEDGKYIGIFGCEISEFYNQIFVFNDIFNGYRSNLK
jgi:hypothetical protein